MENSNIMRIAVPSPPLLHNDMEVISPHQLSFIAFTLTLIKGNTCDVFILSKPIALYTSDFKLIVWVCRLRESKMKITKLIRLLKPQAHVAERIEKRYSTHVALLEFLPGRN